jgi:uncharacterized protein
MAAATILAKRARQVAAGFFTEVPSPCVSVCRMDPATELCEGCLRNLDEIAAWGRMEDGEKKEVWREVAGRLVLRQAQDERGAP